MIPVAKWSRNSLVATRKGKSTLVKRQRNFNDGSTGGGGGHPPTLSKELKQNVQ